MQTHLEDMPLGKEFGWYRVSAWQCEVPACAGCVETYHVPQNVRQATVE